MALKKSIPPQTIGLLGDIIIKHYSASQIDNLFLRSGAPERNNFSYSNKTGQVQTMLRTINDESDNPLEILGAILEDFFDRKAPNSYYYQEQTFDSNELAIAEHEKNCSKITQSLSKAGLQYSKGHVIYGGASSTKSLKENVTRNGLSAVEIEINRSIENVEKDPLAAAHNAGCVMEASLKAYLDHHKVEYKEETDTLSDLWKKVVEHIGIHPKELDDKDLKKIASGLFNIVDGTMHLRNKKSAAHGKSEAQMKQSTIRPRHARLAIHAANTVSAYVLELLETAQ